MKIQCPKCEAKYRTRGLVEPQSPLQVTCPNCQYRFIVAKAQQEKKRPENILIVDDARFFRELMLELLAGRNAEPVTANSVAEGWNLLQRAEFDLLIVDINLPDASGLELIKRIRDDKRFERLAILCISGVYRKDDDARQAMAAGANDFMTKSFHPDDFMLRIDRLLGK